MFFLFYQFFAEPLIHECSHCVSALICGYECYGISWKSLLEWCCYISDSNWFILIAGSCGGIIISVILVLVLYKKNSLYFCVPFIVILTEISYWLISPTIKLGDGYSLIRELYFNKDYVIMILDNITLIISTDYIPHFPNLTIHYIVLIVIFVAIIFIYSIMLWRF